MPLWSFGSQYSDHARHSDLVINLVLKGTPILKNWTESATIMPRLASSFALRHIIAPRNPNNLFIIPPCHLVCVLVFATIDHPGVHQGVHVLIATWLPESKVMLPSCSSVCDGRASWSLSGSLSHQAIGEYGDVCVRDIRISTNLNSRLYC